MSRLSKQHVYAALEKAADNILSASGDDPFVSRKDIRQKLSQLPGIERSLTDIFYRFIDHRDYKPGARVTKADVDQALAYAKETMVDKYDENNNGLSETEIQQMSMTAQLAVRYAQTLKAFEEFGEIEDKRDVADVLSKLGDQLYFPAWANEADAYLKRFRRKSNLDQLTADGFAEVMGLDQNIPAEEIFIFEQATGFSWIFENYGDRPEVTTFQRVYDFMNLYLRDITHIIVGSDGTRETSEYPVYFIGLTEDGSLVGFETQTIWT